MLQERDGEQSRDTNIAFAGLTAVGKTTHARLTAMLFDRQYISSSWILRDMLAIEQKANWRDFRAQLNASRTHEHDRTLDDELVALAESTDGLVIDSWAGCWLPIKTPLIRVLLLGDERSRGMKARVSQEPSGPFLSLEEAVEHVNEIDASARERFHDLHGFDILEDRWNFDVVIDTSTHIRDETLGSVERSIGLVHSDLTAHLRRELDKREYFERASSAIRRSVSTRLALVALSDTAGRLLLLHREDGMYSHWEFPGGKVIDGETPTDAAIREIAEELGIPLSAEGVRSDSTYSIDDRGKTLEVTVFRASVSGSEEKIVMEPHLFDAADWIREDQLRGRALVLSPALRSYISLGQPGLS